MGNNEEKFEYSMNFEMLLRLVLGPKYYQWASLASDKSFFKKAIARLLAKLKKDVSALNSGERLRDLCTRKLETIVKALKKAESANEYRELFIDALEIVAFLIGYDGFEGGKITTPFYEQSIIAEQVSKKRSGKLEEQPWKEAYKVKSELYLAKYKIIQDLKKSGHSYAEIAFIFNDTAYQIKKIESYCEDNQKHGEADYLPATNYWRLFK